MGQILTPGENVAREKKYRSTVRGGQLLAPGDVIQVMDQGSPVKCRVLSCLAVEGGGCLAGLEILEGKRNNSFMTFFIHNVIACAALVEISFCIGDLTRRQKDFSLSNFLSPEAGDERRKLFVGKSKRSREEFYELRMYVIPFEFHDYSTNL